MENIYDPEGMDEDYYSKYQVPLIEVLQRMKRSMIALADEIKRSSRVDLPSTCINFLANCRNLILELETFLINKNCVFNNLMSYIICIHKNNLDKTISLTQQHHKKYAELISEVEKGHHLS